MLDSARQNPFRYRKQYHNSSHTRDQILRLLSLKNCIYQYENTEDQIKQGLQFPLQSKANIASRTEVQIKKKKQPKKDNQNQNTQTKLQANKKTQSERFIRRRADIQNTKKQLLRGSSHLKMRSQSQKNSKKMKGNYNSIQFRNAKGNAQLTTIKHKARTLSHMNNKTKTASQIDKQPQDQYNSQVRLKEFVSKYRNNIQLHKTKLRETDLQHQKIQEIVNEMTGFQQNTKKNQEIIVQPAQFPQKMNHTLQVVSKINLKAKQNKKQQVVKGILKQRYQIIQKIGKGLSGQVYKGKDILSNRFVAIKIIGQQVENKERQYQFYKKVQHKNIVNYLNNFVQNGKRFLVLQYFPFTLETVGKKRKLVLEQIQIIFKNIVNALTYLHGLSIAHRDIKLQNIVCSQDLTIIKLIDFGLCIDLNEQSANVSNQFCGTVHYMPPQMLQKRSYDPKKADIWSLGVLLYKIAFDRYPYRGKDQKQVLSKIYKTKLVFPQYCNQDLKKLVQSMLVRNYTQRATITEVIEHRWLV